MRTVEIKVYKFEELSKEVQEKVVQEHFIFDEWDCGCLSRDYEERLSCTGFFDNIEMSYSLSCCQGDGVSFTADITNLDLLNEHLLKNDYINEKTYKKMKHILYRNVVFLANVGRSNMRYTHKYTVHVNIELEFNYHDILRIESVIEDFANGIEDYKNDLCDEMEKDGYDYIEHCNSIENAQERCDANEYEFLEDGTMY